MSLSKTYATDTTKENEGVKVSMPQNDDGSIPYFIIARTGRANKRYTKALERNMRPVQAQIRTKTLGNEQADTLLMSSFIEGALQSWGNIELADVTGNPEDKGFADFNPENAGKLFTRLPDLFADLTEQANDVALFRSGENEEIAKN